MAVHRQPVVSDIFQEIQGGRQTFLIFINRSDLQVNDVIYLDEHEGDDYTENSVRVVITHMKIEGERTTCSIRLVPRVATRGGL